MEDSWNIPTRIIKDSILRALKNRHMSDISLLKEQPKKLEVSKNIGRLWSSNLVLRCWWWFSITLTVKIIQSRATHFSHSAAVFMWPTAASHRAFLNRYKCFLSICSANEDASLHYEAQSISFFRGKRLRSSFFNKRSGSNLPPLISLLLGYRIAGTKISSSFTIFPPSNLLSETKISSSVTDQQLISSKLRFLHLLYLPILKT